MNESGKGGRKVWRVSGDEDCPHESTTLLGSDGGNNRYYRCQECEAIIIVQGESNPEAERERMEEERREQKSAFDKFMERLG